MNIYNSFIVRKRKLPFEHSETAKRRAQDNKACCEQPSGVTTISTYATKVTLVWNELVVNRDTVPVYTVEFRKEKSPKWTSGHTVYKKTTASIEGNSTV